MRLYGELRKVEAQDDGTIIITGVASTGVVDDAGETVTPSAMKAALPDYMKFGAVREMHGLSAAGTALTASVDDEGNTHLVAHVVDPVAVKKVQTGVYKGLSIGGKVLARDPKDKTVITKLKLNEISLVDRPCNPEAVIGMWKADGAHLEDEAAPDADPVALLQAALARVEAVIKGGASAGVANDVVKANLAEFAKRAPDLQDIDRRLTALGAPRAEAPMNWLLKALGDVKADDKIPAINSILQDVVKRLEIAEAQPAPPKALASALHAVSKAADITPGAEIGAQPSPGDVAAYLDALPDAERQLLITKAALARPLQGIPS